MKLGKSKTELGALGAILVARGLKWLEACRTVAGCAIRGVSFVMLVIGEFFKKWCLI